MKGNPDNKTEKAAPLSQKHLPAILGLFENHLFCSTPWTKPYWF